MNDGISALLGFTSAIVVAAAAAGFAFIRFSKEQKHHRETLLNALLGELINIYQHYAYAAHELPVDDADPFQLETRLKWSKYGKVLSASDIGRLGFLSAFSIRDLLQLQLQIRNDDLFIDQLLGDKAQRNSDNLANLKNRLKERFLISERLLEALVGDHPELMPVFDEVRTDLSKLS